MANTGQVCPFIIATNGYEVKYLNRQVKRNIRRFPEDFMFLLTREEVDNFVKCQFGTSRINDMFHASAAGRDHFVDVNKMIFPNVWEFVNRIVSIVLRKF